jgi:diguanylate cyclase (GGDEF)-like protein
MKNILIVHRSKVVRLTLARHLKSHFDVLEATDCEAGWQLLVLHQNIVALISGLDVSLENDVWVTSTHISGVDSQLSGIELLDRVRNSSPARIKNLPFYLIGSETHIEDITEEARRHKVTGFLYSGMSRDEIFSALNLADTEDAQISAQAPLSSGEDLSAPISSFEATKPKEVALQTLHKVDLLSAQIFRNNLVHFFERSGAYAAVLVFAMDRYADLQAQLGKRAVDVIVAQAARVVQQGLRSGDALGYAHDGAFAVLTPVANLAKCVAFSGRVAKSLSAAKASVRGISVQSTWSVGIASSITDRVAGIAVLELALKRLEQAMREGGGRIRGN